MLKQLFRKIFPGAIILGIIYGCSTDLSSPGTGSEAGNPRVVGTLYEAPGKPALQTIVRLIPERYVAGLNNAANDFPTDTTDSLGCFTLISPEPGTFTLQGVHTLTMKRLFIRDIVIEREQTTTIADDTLREVGALQITVPDSIRKAGGRLAVLGTTYSVPLANDSVIVIDSLPAGSTPAIVYVAPLTTSTSLIAPSIKIVPNDTILLSTHAPKTLLVQPDDDLQSAIDQLLPGDTLRLAGGVYRIRGIDIAVSGNELQPIVIAAVANEAPVLRDTAAAKNCVNFRGASHVIFDGIEIDSTLVDIDGIKFADGPECRYITIRNCTVHNIRGIGINAQGGHYSITVSSNHIYGATGDALSGIRVSPAATSSMPHDWLIEDNWIHNIGDSLSSVAYGISLNAGCQSMTVRDNVIYSGMNSGILVYGLRDPASSGALSTIVEGNVVWNADEGISAYSDVTVRNNVIFDCANPVYSYSYQGAVPRNVLIYNNTMYNGEAPYLRSWDSTNNCIFVNNAVYVMSGGFTLIGNGRITNNAGDVNAAGFIAGTASADLADPANRNFYPKTGSALINSGSRTLSPSADFNGTSRDNQPDVGAYEFTVEGNPGWKIKEGFKGR